MRMTTLASILFMLATTVVYACPPPTKREAPRTVYSDPMEEQQSKQIAEEIAERRGLREKNLRVIVDDIGAVEASVRSWDLDSGNDLRLGLQLTCNNTGLTQNIFLTRKANSCGNDIRFCEMDSVVYERASNQLKVTVKIFDQLSDRCTSVQVYRRSLKDYCK